ncbi:hypothetical protein [Pseudomonas sp. RIT-PI-S]|uniref:hypothetical protein n=1 Tax=Pseudomonas sp. RIT-PI-S TaxID=3035295 RepID=UPI0021DA7E80|nr:hypothetical protein [Pseudomonas sp. RIT-PI-S]
MTQPYTQALSFVATLEVLNTDAPGPVGTWEIQGTSSHGTTLWHGGSWLTSNGRTDRPAQRFWFGAVEFADTGTLFEIRLWRSRGPENNVRVEISRNGYLGLYPLTPAIGPFFRLEQRGEQVHIETVDGRPLRVGYDHSAWTTGRKGHYLNLEHGPVAEFAMQIIEGAVAEPEA